MVDSPSGGAPAKAPRGDLADTEGYGGGNCFSWSPLMFSGYVGIYREEEVGRWSCEGPMRVEGAPRGAGVPPCLVASSLLS